MLCNLLNHRMVEIVICSGFGYSTALELLWIRKCHNKWIKNWQSSIGFCIQNQWDFGLVCALRFIYCVSYATVAKDDDIRKLSEIKPIWYKVKTMYVFLKVERKFILLARWESTTQQKRIDRRRFGFNASFRLLCECVHVFLVLECFCFSFVAKASWK